jgi:long-chain acyl-CoA synthetase
LLSHQNIVFSALTSGRVLKVEAGDVMLSFLPPSHIFERMVLYLSLYYGAQINYSNGPEHLASDLQEVKPTVMSAVPRMLEKMYSRFHRIALRKGGIALRVFEWSMSVASRRGCLISRKECVPAILSLKHSLADFLVYKQVREALGGRIRFIISGGSALPVDLALSYLGMGIPILQGYGLTETSPVISVNTLESNRIGTVGRPLPGVQVMIAEDEEILTRGPHVFQGYFEKPAETESAFVAAGSRTERWFKTGDLGHFDDAGFLELTGRIKDMIKLSGGEQISPERVEDRLRRSEYIGQAVVVGNHRKSLNALIVPNYFRLCAWASANGIEWSGQGDLARDQRVINFIKQEVSRATTDLAAFEKINRIALLPREFTIEAGELTPTLKVRRFVIEERHRELIESMYSERTLATRSSQPQCG